MLGVVVPLARPATAEIYTARTGDIFIPFDGLAMNDNKWIERGSQRNSTTVRGTLAFHFSSAIFSP